MANGSIPVAQKNQLIKEMKTCVIEKGKDPEDCLKETVKAHGLNKKQTQELIDDINNGSEDE